MLPPVKGSDKILLPDLFKPGENERYELVWQDKNNRIPQNLGCGAESKTYLLKSHNGGCELVLKVPSEELSAEVICQRGDFEESVLSCLDGYDSFLAAKGKILTRKNAGKACKYWQRIEGSRIMPRITGSLAYEFIEDGEYIDPELRLTLACKLLRACENLWGQDFVHTDIKPANVFIDVDRQDLQIIDLDGIRAIYSSDANDWSLAQGTEAYMPDKDIFPKLDLMAVDCYAAILTALEILTINGESRAEGIIKYEPDEAKSVYKEDFPGLNLSCFVDYMSENTKQPDEWRQISVDLLKTIDPEMSNAGVKEELSQLVFTKTADSTEEAKEESLSFNDIDHAIQPKETAHTKDDAGKIDIINNVFGNSKNPNAKSEKESVQTPDSFFNKILMTDNVAYAEAGVKEKEGADSDVHSEKQNMQTEENHQSSSIDSNENPFMAALDKKINAKSNFSAKATVTSSTNNCNNINHAKESSENTCKDLHTASQVTSNNSALTVGNNINTHSAAVQNQVVQSSAVPIQATQNTEAKIGFFGRLKRGIASFFRGPDSNISLSQKAISKIGNATKNSDETLDLSQMLLESDREIQQSCESQPETDFSSYL